MPKAIIVSPGDVYGILTVIKESSKRDGKRYFECRCECGTIKEFRLVAIRSGETNSCGCKRNERNRTGAITHGENGSRLYLSWHSMKQRCLNPKCKVFKYYGGRGIKVCEQWMKYEGFRDWALANGYQENLTIERDDVNGNYEPNNCSWKTIQEQNRNKRNNRIIVFKGEKLCVRDWASKLGISNSAMQKRIKNWPLEMALTKPANQ